MYAAYAGSGAYAAKHHQPFTTTVLAVMSGRAGLGEDDPSPVATLGR